MFLLFSHRRATIVTTGIFSTRSLHPPINNGRNHRNLPLLPTSLRNGNATKARNLRMIFHGNTMGCRPVLPYFRHRNELLHRLKLRYTRLNNNRVEQIQRGGIRLPLQRNLPMNRRVSLRQNSNRCQKRVNILLRVTMYHETLLRAYSLYHQTRTLRTRPRATYTNTRIRRPKYLRPDRRSNNNFNRRLDVNPKTRRTKTSDRLGIGRKPTTTGMLRELPNHTTNHRNFRPLYLLYTRQDVDGTNVPTRYRPRRLNHIGVHIKTTYNTRTYLRLPGYYPKRRPYNCRLPSSKFSNEANIATTVTASVVLSSNSGAIEYYARVPNYQVVQITVLSSQPRRLDDS